MMIDRLKNTLPNCTVSIDRDIIEVKVQNDAVFWITEELGGFKLYIGYNAPNSICLKELNEIAKAAKGIVGF